MTDTTKRHVMLFSGFNAAAAVTDAMYSWFVVRLWHTIAVTNFTITVLLTTISRLLLWCLQHAAAATIATAAVFASAAVRAGLSGMLYSCCLSLSLLSFFNNQSRDPKLSLVKIINKKMPIYGLYGDETLMLQSPYTGLAIFVIDCQAGLC